MVLRLALILKREGRVSHYTNAKIASIINGLKAGDVKKDMKDKMWQKKYRKALTKLADPDLHMIQMDLAYTSDKKIYTI